MELQKAEDSYERVLVLNPIRKQFFRKLVRFLDKHLKTTLSITETVSPYLACQIANYTLLRFSKSLIAVLPDTNDKQLELQ